MTAIPRALGAVVLVATTALAHWQTPDEVVAELNAPALRATSGVERATRDPKSPRLLVVRVGAGWYALAAEERREQAEEWLALWRHNVAQGIVAVLDARTERPVVRFAPGGTVAGVAREAPR